MNENYVLAMYDVRGIQDYIYRTPKVKDTIGASKIVEDIIPEALVNAITKVKEQSSNEITYDIDWADEKGPLQFCESDKDVQVLYIGGGNAFVLFSSRELCDLIAKSMSVYVIRRTYSMQLATACVPYSGDYQRDYTALMKEMDRVKHDMIEFRPIGALPVMKVDKKTGYPITQDGESTETVLKRGVEERVRRDIEHEEKVFDNYVTEKGKDSMIAVVHIDGNNMGLCIRKLIENEIDYVQAVNKMRNISFNINHAYKSVFDSMKDKFQPKDRIDNRRYFVMKVLTAGDDITYICNGKIALDTVEYFCNLITQKTMWHEENETSKEDLQKYGFSICAGVAYIGSHFPFYDAYEIAEACCESAKRMAKEGQYKDGDRIGSWVDFQICKNVYAKNLESIREKEYVSPSGEKLLRRPYCILTDSDQDATYANTVRQNEKGYEQFEKALRWFAFEAGENLPRSFAKAIRNAYPLGKGEIQNLVEFLKSRGKKIPSDEAQGEEITIENMYMYTEEGTCAKWYDALELMDLVEEKCDETKA